MGHFHVGGGRSIRYPGSKKEMTDFPFQTQPRKEMALPSLRR